MENKILELFLYNNSLKFSEIEKSLKTSSNKLTYHLKQLVKRGVLVKNGDFYELSDASEVLIPYLSDKRAVLPVVLVHIGSDKEAFLYERVKKPFKGLLSLPGGRLLVNESVEQAAVRIMKEKFNTKIKFRGVRSVSLEHVKREEVIHSFLLILVSAEADVELTKVNENKLKIIPSDYKLVKKRGSGMKIRSLVTNVS